MDRDTGRRGVQSDEKLLNILEAIRGKGIRRVTGLADEFGWSKSTVHSHLATLEEFGFVTKSGDEYHIGLRFLDYGNYARERQIVYRASREKVDEIAEETGERVWCLTEENARAVYLYSATGSNAVHTDEDVGRYTTFHQIAAGKAILAYLPPARVDEIVDETGLNAYTDETITDRAALDRELEEIRDRKVAYNLQESMEGLHAIAAPIRRTDEGVYGAISVGGPANRLTRDRLETELRTLLLGIANEIEINVRHMDPDRASV